MLKDVLDRIDRRLAAVGLNESAAAKAAGLSDSAIRNVRRAVKQGKEGGVSSTTLKKLAPVLKTSSAWLLTGEGREDDHSLRDAAEIRELLQRIGGLTPENVTVLLAMIDGFQRANAAPPSQTQLDDQSELATPRRESSPFR